MKSKLIIFYLGLWILSGSDSLKIEKPEVNCKFSNSHESQHLIDFNLLYRSIKGPVYMLIDTTEISFIFIINQCGMKMPAELSDENFLNVFWDTSYIACPLCELYFHPHLKVGELFFAIKANNDTLVLDYKFPHYIAEINKRNEYIIDTLFPKTFYPVTN